MEKRFTIRDILPPLDREEREEIMREAGNAVVSSIQQWYTSKGESYFDGDNHGDGARSFMRGVQSHWFSGDTTPDGFSVYFSHPRENSAHFGLLLHEYGGTVTPKNSKYIAVPIDKEARGLRVKMYEDTHGELKFLPRKNSQKPNLRGVLAWQNENNELITAYALYTSVTIPSLMQRKGVPAIPPDEEVQQMAHTALIHLINAK